MEEEDWKTENYCFTCKDGVVSIWLRAGKPPLGDPRARAGWIFGMNNLVIPLPELLEIMKRIEVNDK